MKTKENFFLVDFLIDRLNKKTNSFLIYNKLGQQNINNLVPFILYNNVNIIQKLYDQNNIKKQENNSLKSRKNEQIKISIETCPENYRKVYQSLYLKQIPLQLTQLYITTTPQFKDNLTFSGPQNKKQEKNAKQAPHLLSNTLKKTDEQLVKNLFYNLFLKNYATSNILSKQQKNKKSSTSSDHIAYNLNTLESIKTSNPNFSNILTPICLFLKKKRQISLINKNISNKKIKRLYYSWYRVQVTRRYLNSINQKINNEKKLKNKFYLLVQKEQRKINKFKSLKKML